MSMHDYAMGPVFGTELAKRLGLDPKHVQSMTLKVIPDDVVTLEVVYLPSNEDLEVLMKYDLVLRPPTPERTPQ
jgi:hypothetical protein